MTVAALYVDPDGVYAGIEGVDLWDEARDARLYAGPWPVVAHPPCNKWSPLAYINSMRLPGYVFGDDGGCFEAALEAVERYGGVLEHPAVSHAWRKYGLPRPSFGGWTSTLTGRPGFATEVDQGAYGHPAVKRTWLYYVGPEPPALDWRTVRSDVMVSGFTHQKPGQHVACEHRRVRPKEAAATPEAFRDVLLEMARGAAQTCPSCLGWGYEQFDPEDASTCLDCNGTGVPGNPRAEDREDTSAREGALSSEGA